MWAAFNLGLVCGGSDVFSPNCEEPEPPLSTHTDPDPDLYANTHPTSGHHLPHIFNQAPSEYNVAKLIGFTNLPAWCR